MKIRLGFVSNSSSSSYFVTIHDISKKDLIQWLVSLRYGYTISKESIKNTINENISRINDSMIRLTGRGIDNGHLIPYYSTLKSNKDLLIRIEGMSQQELVGLFLEMNYISVIEENGNITLVSGTSMHNDYVSGITSELQEIIFELIFESKFKVTFRREGES